jgi:hypothetical protein
MRWKKKATNPINAKELTYEVLLSKGLGKLTSRAKKMFIILAEHAIHKKPYYDAEDKKDCLQTAYLNIFTNWQSFNPDKTNNAFAYFTEVHKRSSTEMLNELYFKKGLKKDEQKYIKTISINSTNNGNGLYNI